MCCAIERWEADASRTESFDDMPLDATHERFEPFFRLEEYLRKTFPTLYGGRVDQS